MKKPSLLTTLVLFYFITINNVPVANAGYKSDPIFNTDIMDLFGGLTAGFLLNILIIDPSDPIQVSGGGVFYQTTPTNCRSVMKFTRGFTSPNPHEYTFTIGEYDVSKRLTSQISINIPGSSPFECDFDEFSCQEIVGKQLIVKHKDTVIGEFELQELKLKQ